MGDDGVLRFTFRSGTSHTLDHARENIAAARSLTELGKRNPHLVDFAGIHSITRDARAYYAGADAAQLTVAVAILVNSFLSRAIGNFFIGFNKSIRPTRLFSSEAEALGWLEEFRE